MARVTKGGTEFDPAALDRIEARFWRELWDAVPAPIAPEHGVRRADFGPIQANIVADLPAVPMLNLVFDSAAADAAEEGFLAEAIEWTRGQGVQACVPVTPGLPGSERATSWLESNGFAPIPGWMKFVRDPHPPRFETAADVEVVEVVGDRAATPAAPPFAAVAAAAFDLPAWVADLFAGLPGRPGWRCYVARVDGDPQACAAMFLDGEAAELGIGGTLEGGRRRGCQLALLRRRVEDAAAAGVRTLFVETGARVPGHPSSSYGNILRAGFEEAYLCPGWIDARLPAG
ncbi:MAG TPA: GNAT family N-acetyltransferase [Solirubrobacterales bacterium]|nr:GNAT family N-acetyltransferase [Solirubrobacterales bacterium]